MANVSTPYSGILTPDSTENVDIPADMLQMANSFDARLIGFFPDLASRDAAAASFIAAGKRLFAYVYSSGVFIYNGAAWETLGSVSPVQYTSGSGASAILPGIGTPVTFAAATYGFTPSRTGWAEVGFDIDVSRISAGFGYVAIQAAVSVNGGVSWTQLSDTSVLNDTDPRSTTNGYRIWGNYKVNQGAALVLRAAYYSFFPSGTFQINNLVWHVVQQ